VDVLMTPPRIEHLKTAKAEVTYGENFQVFILAPKSPQIGLKSQSKVTVKLGESTKLECKATGEPLPKIIWISPQKDVITLSTEKFEIMDDGMLIIKKVSLGDEGKYACVARNSVGGDIKYTMVEVEHQKPFINGMKGESSTKLLGVSYQTALMDCRVEGKPVPKIWWITPYGLSLTTPYLGGRFQVHQNGSLELRGVRKTDEGTYICKATNAYGSTALSYPVTVMVFPPRITTTMPPITKINQGTPVILQCVANGMPKPDISWTLPGRIHISQEGYLVIQNPVLTNSGIYKCNAKNALGTDFKSTYLQVFFHSSSSRCSCSPLLI
uniref:Ig-like domain-containing protein n=1 Tax=Oryzias sinensis TaxID=183150 RepID=A0A8C7YJ37_9TELE